MFNVLQNAMMVVAQAAGSAAPAAATPPAAPQTLQPAADALNAAAAAAASAPPPAPAVPDMGFMHFVAQSDFVGKTLFIILILMSVVTWYLIVVKAISNVRMRNRAAVFLNHFWNAGSLKQAENEIVTHGARDPFSHLASHAIHAQSHHAKFGATKLEEAGSNGEFVTRTMRKVIDEETAKLENGLTILASVGSTAPFVGLFGTVWGVYHALVGIGLSDGVTISRIAGPVGEALIMTGLGLAVAIPAVLAYNAFVRNNRVFLSRLDAFAHDLFAFLTTGQQVAVSDGKVRALRRQGGQAADARGSE
ncbi:MotA/TolQ/ExbB proton channel family protein [Bordetella holmesii]|uniref:MotA/TolQ/ExbB proton channel family protein n=1 Tax=Bordetella holmesii TaxID=35814 RepID=UPI0012985C66|nr:MotA/TolQ/ExbB proton channel family protein [Bordetella holmesii]QGE33098.1 MotA/TolQ/ExbB proton channel family protein [Bordetella holmesii]